MIINKNGRGKEMSGKKKAANAMDIGTEKQPS